MQLPANKTKIICTIGPASQSQETLRRMLDKGMNIARVNLTHGDLESHALLVRNIRAAAASAQVRVAIWGDLPGPKLRIGRLAHEPVRLEHGQPFVLQAEENLGDASRASVSLVDLSRVVRAGDRIYLNDGNIQLEVEGIVGQEIGCRVLAGGELRTNDGVNVPGIHLPIPVLTDQDLACLAFAAQQRLDALSPSFIQDATDIAAVRQAAAEIGYHPILLAKIERALAVQNLDAILESADATVIARGDLGVETPVEEIAVLQKHIIRRSHLAGKPVITATHMLESMTRHRRPTRAEATDVANAILDGTDCVTLSAETALGDFPEDAVVMMARIARAAEPHVDRQSIARGIEPDTAGRQRSTEDHGLPGLPTIVRALEPAAVILPTRTGRSAGALSRQRLPVWIVAVCCDETTCQALQLSYGVHPVHEAEPPASWEQYARTWLHQYGVEGDRALLVQDPAAAKIGGSKPIQIIARSDAPGGRSLVRSLPDLA